jgi:hypothetical protein
VLAVFAFTRLELGCAILCGVLMETTRMQPEFFKRKMNFFHLKAFYVISRVDFHQYNGGFAICLLILKALQWLLPTMNLWFENLTNFYKFSKGFSKNTKKIL